MLIFIALMGKNQDKNQGLHLKPIITAALSFMMVGTGMELVLLGHYEDALQLIPLLCIGVSILLVLVLLFKRTDFLFNVFKVILGMTALSGFYGTFLHLRANYEFEKEMKVTAHGWNLVLESFSGALPSLAPASMVVLALIGYSYIILLKQK